MFVAPLARQILHRRLFSGLILESLLSGELAYNEQLNERLFTLIVNVPQEKFLKGLLIYQLPQYRPASRFMKSYKLVIVTDIWQKLSSVKRGVTLIVTHFWQLFSQIFGQTLLAFSIYYLG